jgi:hypothetical protein
MNSFIGGGIATKRLALEPGEVLVKEAWCRAVCRKPLLLLYQGKLFLTSLRLVYLKHRLALPLPRQWRVEVPYECITRARLAAGPLIWPTITIETEDHIYDFSLYGSRSPFGVWFGRGAKKVAEEFIDTINEMRRSRDDESRSS